MNGRLARFVVDCGVVLRLAGEGLEVPSGHELLAPTLLRSQTVSALHEAVHRGEMAAEVAEERLARIQSMSIRLLGDAVLRRVAWKIADQLGWAETYDAEYLALTQLQADAYVTLDAELARRVEGVVPTATIDAANGLRSSAASDTNPEQNKGATWRTLCRPLASLGLGCSGTATTTTWRRFCERLRSGAP